VRRDETDPVDRHAEGLGRHPVRLRRGLEAAHAWDIAGALRAGAAAAFVARGGRPLDPLVERPDIVGRDIGEVADAIITVERA